MLCWIQGLWERHILDPIHGLNLKSVCAEIKRLGLTFVGARSYKKWNLEVEF